jgi:hypothetical protein
VTIGAASPDKNRGVEDNKKTPETLPMKAPTVLAAFLAASILSACSSLEEAQMVRPPALQTASSTPISGIGGGQRGSYAAGLHTGSFSRSATKLSFFDLYTARDGGAKFSLTGPEFTRGVDAACKMRERSITIDIVEFKPAAMAFGCDFSSGGTRMAAMLEVQESRPGLTNKQERRGEIMVDGAVLKIRSVHEIAGSILPVPAPIGYVFERKGATVGGVQLNGAPVMFEATGADGADRKAILLAAVALSVFWDPANLED